mgnify:CR=1 FL=1
MQREHIDNVSTYIPLERKCGFYELYIKRMMDIVCSLAASRIQACVMACGDSHSGIRNFICKEN